MCALGPPARLQRVDKCCHQQISNQPPAGPPATIQTRVQSTSPRALRRRSTNHRGSSDKSTHIHATRVPSPSSDAICHTQSISLTTHGHCVERRRRWQRHARADGFGRGGAATAWAAAAPSATSTPSAQLERGQAQGSVAARGSAAAVASRRAAGARRGGQVIGRRVMGRRVTAPSDRRRRAV